jgi:hypothetical protein
MSYGEANLMIDWEEAVTEGIEARKSQDKAQWKLGDLACALVTTYGGRTLAKYAEEIGVEFNTLQEYRRVAGTFEKSTRVDNLTWSHHRTAAAWNNPGQWLSHAVKGKWSVETMKAEQAKAVQRAATTIEPSAAQSAVGKDSTPLSTSTQPLSEAKGLGREDTLVGNAGPAPATNPVVDDFVSRVTSDFPNDSPEESVGWRPPSEGEYVRAADYEGKALQFRDAIIALHEFVKEDAATLSVLLDYAVELTDNPLTPHHIWDIQRMFRQIQKSGRPRIPSSAQKMPVATLQPLISDTSRSRQNN